jgi:hypothetical protein
MKTIEVELVQSAINALTRLKKAEKELAESSKAVADYTRAIAGGVGQEMPDSSERLFRVKNDDDWADVVLKVHKGPKGAISLSVVEVSGV